MKKYFLIALSSFLLFFNFIKANADNEMVTFMDQIGTNGLATSGEIMATPVGQILYFVIGMVVIVTVVGVFLSVFGFFKRD